MAASLRPAFTFNLNHRTIVNRIKVGKYDGTHSCLTAVTSADKIIIHSANKKPGLSNTRMTWSEAHHDIASINLNQPVTAIETGDILPENRKQILLIGSPTHILAYHVDENTDIFYNEVKEGVRTLLVGTFGSFTNQIVLVGGSHCIRGFDHTGLEIYWTVTSGNVLSMGLADINKDGKNELIVGSDDASIKIYKEDGLAHEVVESGPVIDIIRLDKGNMFAYSLNNGTVGVYEETLRLWRIKSKNVATSITSYDILGMGNQQLITGWSNGKVDVRDCLNGDVLYKFHFTHSITCVTQSDYRGVGSNDLIICSQSGEVRGYEKSKTNLSSISSFQQEQLRTLLTTKQNLQLELSHYENNIKFNKDVLADETKLMGFPEEVGVIPANTRLQIGIATNTLDRNNPHIEISVCTNNATYIRAVIIYAEGIFKGETFIVHPNTSKGASRIEVPIKTPKDITYDVHIKTLVGFPESQQFHVFELTRQLPMFAMYAIPATLTGSPKTIKFMNSLSLVSKEINGHVTFTINERIQRICLWINQNFLLPADIECSLMDDNSAELKLQLVNLRNKKDLSLHFMTDNTVTFKCEDLEVCGNLVQSLIKFLNVEHLMSTASFPDVNDQLYNHFTRLTGLQEAYKNLTLDTSQKKNMLKNLMVRAEDARLHNENDLQRYYMDLGKLNDDLVSSYTIRRENINEMQKILEAINKILHMATKLRAGKYATNLMQLFKGAIKAQNVNAIIKILETGSS